MPNTRLQPIIMKSPTGMPDFGVKVIKIQNLVSFSASTGWVTLSELLFLPCNGCTGQSKVPLEPYTSHKIFHIFHVCNTDFFFLISFQNTQNVRFAEIVHFFRPPLLYVFGCCDLINSLIEMLHTILELADYPIYRSAVLDAFRWLPSCIQNAVCRNSFFRFPLLYLFWSSYFKNAF